MTTRRLCGAVCALAALTNSANASIMFSFTDPSGLSAEAEFVLIDPTTLEITLRNTSTAVPDDFDNSDQLLTGLSWDFGAPGEQMGDRVIVGGLAEIGASSASVNFDKVMSQLGPGDDVSGEWGYGNNGRSGALTNFISTNRAGAVAFGGANLDGPVNLSGPQGGLIADPILVDIGGLGAIQNEIVATVTLSAPITEAELKDDFSANGVRVEFGSDAAFITVPEPVLGGVLLLAGGAVLRRRRGG